MLDQALGAAGCGCATLDRAERARDPDEAEAYRDKGARERAVWRCPCGTGALPPGDPAELPGPAREALVAVEHLTGARGLTTCPLFYARLPWVRDAVEARKWAERGELRSYAGAPSRVLLDAISAVDAGIAARQAADEHERELKRKTKT